MIVKNLNKICQTELQIDLQSMLECGNKMLQKMKYFIPGKLAIIFSCSVQLCEC